MEIHLFCRIRRYLEIKNFIGKICQPLHQRLLDLMMCSSSIILIIMMEKFLYSNESPNRLESTFECLKSVLLHKIIW